VLQPGLASGDFEFHADAAAIRPGSPGRTLVRIQVQIPLLRFLDQTKADRAEVRLRVRAFEADPALSRLALADSAAPARPESLQARYKRTDAAADEALDRFEGIAVVAEAESRTRLEASRTDLRESDFRLLELVVELPPGDHVIEVRGENLSREKRGLLDRLRNRPLAATARLLVRVPDLTHEPSMADPVFEMGHGTHSPYPARLYGLLNDSLHARVRVFGHGSYALEWLAANRDGEVAWRDSTRLEAEGETETTISTSVNTVPAGQYVLRFVATGPGGSVSTSRSFDVAWALVTWERAWRDLDLEAELALSEESFAAYRTLPVGEKEAYMQDFWHTLDPSPDTADNEVLDEFHRRVAYADLSYSEVVRGALTDRGRIHVHFGRPDEIQAEAIPSHLAGQGAESVLEKVENVFQPTEHQRDDPLGPLSGGSAEGDPRARRQRQQERDRLIGPANEVTSYELWVYTGGGQPLFPEVQAVTMDTGLRVLFVDLTGYGRYRLRKSSVRLPIHGLTPEF
jgi:GWxTD domain-containing protein